MVDISFREKVRGKGTEWDTVKRLCHSYSCNSYFHLINIVRKAIMNIVAHCVAVQPIRWTYCDASSGWLSLTHRPQRHLSDGAPCLLEVPVASGRGPE